MRFLKASDADMPVTFSMISPSSTVLVLQYSNSVSGAEFTGWEKAIRSSSAGLHAFFGS